MSSVLQDKTALITGASSGIGAAIARTLAQQGVHLALSGRNDERLKQVGDFAAQRGVDVWRYTADLTIDEEVGWLAETAEEDLGGIDILIHSAGLVGYGALADTPISLLDRMWRINTHAPCVLTQRLLPALKTSAGDVVFVNSRAGLHPPPGMAHYGATKAALRALADGLRAEVGSDGIRVLSVFPGRIATPMQAGLCEAAGIAYRPELLPTPEDVAKAVAGALKMPDTTELTEINIGPQRNPAARKESE